MEVEVIPKKWGNSLGCIFPKEFVKEEGIKLNKKIVLKRVKPANLRHLFGSLKTKMSGQEFKDLVRRGSM